MIEEFGALEGRTLIVFATRAIASREPGARIARSRQSAEATDLLVRLAEKAGAPAVSSRSHSRTMVAAATALSPSVTVGIDVEWMAPERPIREIARYLLGDLNADVGRADFYRLWTFREAYFKAFQRIPAPALALEFLNRDDGHAVHRLEDGVNVLQRRVADMFQLALVWRGGGADCMPVDLSACVDSPCGQN